MQSNVNFKKLELFKAYQYLDHSGYKNIKYFILGYQGNFIFNLQLYPPNNTPAISETLPLTDSLSEIKNFNAHNIVPILFEINTSAWTKIYFHIGEDDRHD